MRSIRSYFILGIYSIMAAAFYSWDASLFVLMSSLFIEMILLFIGTILVGKNSKQRLQDVGRAGAFYALLACTAFIYPMALIMGNTYEEFTSPPLYGYIQPIVDYKWQILLMTISLGVGYLADFKSLKKRELANYISNEVFRVCFLIFGVGLLGMMCLEFIEELAYMEPVFPLTEEAMNPYTEESKMYPIMAMIIARIGIEMWYLFRIKKNDWA